ncbi:MAG TPA: WecB/TagA/CpsF family glycosyltransferase [Leptospiraceae bacterium]|nr:WecB/TagA/CpsF family glycosyltransferase [Leptospiraceae bacterium]HMY65933.1 WecB/TagA/CpsF family glycosyltransferase [Leptospiraceae bacterium]HMZ59956.1 WecB/TagA/CpsF family glycosyltransferase [Leptospiraceae bacterium]HNF12800.1 WecB/TagA/CpsF family glycosyltransferase [Leptospiraceae bacterium]HNI25185.1 WecB/TagA/CpsF family glycosyltransferase [Leptospiraceae bacterium]
MKQPFEVVHNSAKEEKDYVLEYQKIDVTERPKLTLDGVEFDNITRDHAVAVILDYIKKKERFHHILFLDPVKFMNVRETEPLHRITKKTSMILAESGGLSWAASKTGQSLVEHISIISLMMDLIRYSEKQGLTIFFLGSKEKTIETVFFNLVRHFPEIRIVGRHSGYLTRERDLMVKEAIRKTSPDIIFLGMNFPEQEVWIENNTGYFGKSVIIGTWSTFDVLAGKLQKSPSFFQDRGLYWLWKVISHPWRMDKVLRTIQFFVHFAFYRKKNTEPVIEQEQQQTETSNSEE